MYNYIDPTNQSHPIDSRSCVDKRHNGFSIMCFLKSARCLTVCRIECCCLVVCRSLAVCRIECCCLVVCRSLSKDATHTEEMASFSHTRTHTAFERAMNQRSESFL